ncbi:MAG TPA: response regulator [Actinomycetota bacterium]|nr:response regulator [Actinomycetota bacterium]
MIRAESGEIGMDLARTQHPDLILLDLHLPDISGEVALSRLKNDPETMDIPVIVVSGEGDEVQIRRLEEHGMDRFVSKPIDVPRFLEVFDETLSSRSGHRVAGELGG